MSGDRAHQGDEESKSIVDIKVDASLRGIGELKGVLNNAIKALSRGLSRAYEPLGRIFDAKADRAVVNERAQLILDLARKRNELAEIEKQLKGASLPMPVNKSERAFEYLIDEALRKQTNRESIADAALLELQQSPPTEPVPEFCTGR